MPRTILHIPNEVKRPACGHEYVHPVAQKVEPVSSDTIGYKTATGPIRVPHTRRSESEGFREPRRFYARWRISGMRCTPSTRG